MNVKELLLSVLTWVGESPFRLFVLFIVGIMLLSGWFVYTEKDAFMASYRAQQALPRMNGKYEEAANFIVKRGNADLVAIFEVNPILNTRKLVYLFIRDEGRIRTYDDHDVGLFTKNVENNKDVISLMGGNMPCGAYTKPQSFIGFVYKDKNINYTCRISIPPDPSTFIGQITVGWKEQPEDLESAKITIYVAAEMLYSGKK
jgi:hypothetical protein